MTTTKKSFLARKLNKDDNSAFADVDPHLGLQRAMRFAQTKSGPTQEIAKEAIKDILILIEKAIIGIDGIKSTLQRARSVLETARAHSSNDEIPALQDEYEAHLSHVDKVAASCALGQKNLIDGHQTQFGVPLSDQGRSNFLVLGCQLTIEGMGLPSPEIALSSVEALEEGLSTIDRAIAYVDQAAKTYCANASVLAKHYTFL